MNNKKPVIAIIAAMDEGLGIGFQGKMPWQLSADLKRFKKITMDHPVIMGRKTFQSLPKKPLPGRKNIVITRNKEFNPEGTLIVSSPEEAIQACKDHDIAFVIGGGEIYREFLPLADMLYLTLIIHHFPADTFFPEYDIKKYVIVEEQFVNVDEQFEFPYKYLILKKNK